MINIKKYRGMLDISQEELARRLGVTRPMVCYLEKKETHDIDRETANKLCSIFGCELIDLYGLDNFRVLPSNDKEILSVIKMLLSRIEDNDLKEELKNGIHKRY